MPGLHLEDEIASLVVARAIRHDAYRLNGSGDDARLFLALAPQRGFNALTPALMPPGRAIKPVHETGLRAPQHEHLRPAVNERVDDNRKRISCHATYPMA